MFFYALTILWKQKFFLSKMIKAVIFDLDGVLVAAKDWHYEALNKIHDLEITFDFNP